MNKKSQHSYKFLMIFHFRRVFAVETRDQSLAATGVTGGDYIILQTQTQKLTF